MQQKKIIDFMNKVEGVADNLQKRAFKTKLPPISPFGYRYSTFNRRMLAAILDCCIIFLTVVPLSNMLALMQVGAVSIDVNAFLRAITSTPDQTERYAIYQHYLVDTGVLHYFLLNSFYQTVGIAAYCLFFWNKFSATPGKMVTRQVILDAKTGERITMRQGVVRFIGYIIASLAMMIGIVWIIFDKRKQGWHDKIASTIVVVNKRVVVEEEAGGEAEDADSPS